MSAGRAVAGLFLMLTVASASAQERLASDFEIQTAKKRLELQRDPLARLADYLNLGDLHRSRGQAEISRGEYETAAGLALDERMRSRRSSDLTRYATATAWEGLARAKLGDAATSFDLFEESIRYSSDSAKTWNLYSSAMLLLGDDQKAAATARNAVKIADREAETRESAENLLDLAIYRYSLASALLSAPRNRRNAGEAEALLVKTIEVLGGPAFDPLRRRIARSEQFEIYSSTRGDAAAYLSISNRARLRLAALYESQRRTTDAIRQYEAVLAQRSDDAVALAAMAQLANHGERERWFAASFEANPFSLPLIGQYEELLRDRSAAPVEGDSAGAIMQRALQAHADHRYAVSGRLLSELDARFPDNETVIYLQARNAIESGRLGEAGDLIARLSAGSELRLRASHLLVERQNAVMIPLPFLEDGRSMVVDPSAEQLSALALRLTSEDLTPAARSRLDDLVFSATVRFDPPSASDHDTTTFVAGSIGGVRVRFSSPATFRGRFDSSSDLRLEFRIAGVTRDDDRPALLIDPVRLTR